MFKNFLFTMSLSGTTVFLLYIILYPLAYRFFPVRWRYYTLCTCIFFYLFPLPLLKNSILFFLCSQPVIQETSILQPKVNMDNSFLIVYYSDDVQIAPEILHLWGFIGFCGIITLILALRSFYYYRKAKKAYTTAAIEQVPQQWQKLLQETKAQLKIHKEIRLLCSGCCTSPVTWGAFSPVILFPVPSEDIDDEAFQLMLKHELTHIKYHHLYVKYIGLLVRAVHWFNPLVYLWFRELCNLSEMMCDEIVTKNMEPEQGRQYCHMILSCAANDASCPLFPFSAHLSEDAVVLRRRIFEMKNKKRKRLVPTLLLTLTLGMSGAITAFAYTPPDVLRVDEERQNAGDIYKITADEGDTDSIIEIPYDYYYTDSDGNIYPLSEDMVTFGSCSHQSLVPIKVTQHTADGRGGCYLTEKQAQKCSKCGNIEFGDEIYATHYNKCPHQQSVP